MEDLDDLLDEDDTFAQFIAVKPKKSARKKKKSLLPSGAASSKTTAALDPSSQELSAKQNSSQSLPNSNSTGSLQISHDSSESTKQSNPSSQPSSALTNTAVQPSMSAVSNEADELPPSQPSSGSSFAKRRNSPGLGRRRSLVSQLPTHMQRPATPASSSKKSISQSHGGTPNNETAEPPSSLTSSAFSNTLPVSRPKTARGRGALAMGSTQTPSMSATSSVLNLQNANKSEQHLSHPSGGGLDNSERLVMGGKSPSLKKVNPGRDGGGVGGRAATGNNSAHHQLTANLQREILELKSKNSELQNELLRMKSKMERIQQSERDEINRLQTEVTTLRKEKTEILTEHSKELMELEQNLRIENARMNTQRIDELKRAETSMKQALKSSEEGHREQIEFKQIAHVKEMETMSKIHQRELESLKQQLSDTNDMKSLFSRMDNAATMIGKLANIVQESETANRQTLNEMIKHKREEHLSKEREMSELKTRLKDWESQLKSERQIIISERKEIQIRETQISERQSKIESLMSDATMRDRQVMMREEELERSRTKLASDQRKLTEDQWVYQQKMDALNEWSHRVYKQSEKVTQLQNRLEMQLLKQKKAEALRKADSSISKKNAAEKLNNDDEMSQVILTTQLDELKQYMNDNRQHLQKYKQKITELKKKKNQTLVLSKARIFSGNKRKTLSSSLRSPPSSQRGGGISLSKTLPIKNPNLINLTAQSAISRQTELSPNSLSPPPNVKLIKITPHTTQVPLKVNLLGREDSGGPQTPLAETVPQISHLSDLSMMTEDGNESERTFNDTSLSQSVIESALEDDDQDINQEETEEKKQVTGDNDDSVVNKPPSMIVESTEEEEESRDAESARVETSCDSQVDSAASLDLSDETANEIKLQAVVDSVTADTSVPESHTVSVDLDLNDTQTLF